MSSNPSNPSEAEAALLAVVSGRVQGVGFRYFVQKRATKLGVQGTVCNQSDGTVEVQARAPRECLERLIEELRKGPSMSRVDGVEVQWDFPVPPAEGFRITPG